MNKETELMSQCPSFNTCNAPKCPLDPLINKRVYLTGDETCKARQITRFNIGENSKLKYKGLFKGEWQFFIEGIGECAKSMPKERHTAIINRLHKKQVLK